MMSHPRMLPIQRAIFTREIRRRRLQFAGLVVSVSAAAVALIVAVDAGVGALSTVLK